MIGKDGKDCPFCKKAQAQEYDFKTEWDFDTIISFEPLNPVTPGHRLFLPYHHVIPNEYGFGSFLSSVIKAAEEWINGGDEDTVPDYNLILNSGTDATQTVEHLHLHYVPRRPGDGLILPWTNQVKH